MLYLSIFTKFFNKIFFYSVMGIIFSFFLQVSSAQASDSSKQDKKQDELKFSTPPLVHINEGAAKRQALALNKARMGLKSWLELTPALEDALQYSQSFPQNANAVEHEYIPWSRITASLVLLKKLLPRLDKEPELLAKNFKWYKVNPPSHFTSYYSPVIQASLTKKAGYSYPIYRLPDELAPELAHCLAEHICPDEVFTSVIKADPPFHSREAIDLDQALKEQGLEIAWLKHPLDVYSLMLQGSGYLEFDDGTGRAVLFAGLNGHSGESMAGYLMRTKNIAKKDATIEGIKTWWDKNPTKRRAFLEATPGYVFFRFGPAEPQGTIGGPLVPWVSLAVDKRVIPLGGILAYYIPTKGKTKAGVLTSGNNNYLQGLGFAQDTGGAIKMTRIDLYAGKGEKAHEAAMSVYNKGQVWLLLH